MNTEIEYSYGDYVIYHPTSGRDEIGRVTHKGFNSNDYYVCYSDGCTANLTPYDMIRPANDLEIYQASKHIGFHRFDKDCPYSKQCTFLGCINKFN